MPTTDKHFDCAIIGAGVVGLTIAQELLSAGLSVCVIDRQAPGREASWAGAGILPPGSRYSDHPSLEQLARISAPLNAKLSEQIREATGLDDGYWQCGGLYLTSDPTESAGLDAMIARWTRADIQTQRATAATVARIAPNSQTEAQQLAADFSSYYAPSEAQLRNPRRLKGLVALGESRGATFVFHDAVGMMRPQRDSVCLELLTGQRIEAARVCVAAGAWSNPFLPAVAERPRVRPVRGQMLLLEAPEGTRPLLGNVHVNHLYAAPRRDGRILVGSTVEEAGYDKSTTAEACGELLRFASRIGLGGLKLERSWAGLRPASDDSLPLVGPLPEDERILFATGHFRSGLQFAPATAVLIREIILGQQLSMDIQPFRLDR